MLTGEEIRRRLVTFAQRWSPYAGSERAEAQTFLNELLDCYGTDRRDVATFEEPQEGRFLDLIWQRVCLIEMKRPSEAARLDRHRKQALDYWQNSSRAADGVPAPRYVVLCAFRRLEIWEPGQYPKEPRVVLDLVELPDRYDALLFLAGGTPVFHGGQEAVTRQAVAHVTDLYATLQERLAADLDELREFVLQAVWCLFAEDLGLLPSHLFTRLVDGLIADQTRSSADDLGQLFAWLNEPGPKRPGHGLYAGVPYANGGLFAQPTRVHLEPDELSMLREAATFQWHLVEPSIFGSLLEGGLGHDKQWALGAHYTHEVDIQQVVQPTVVQPWRERIENLSDHRQAAAAQSDLLRYVVLDPACGSGNFLYVAYRELRRLEQRLAERTRELQRAAGRRADEALSLYFPLQNVKGIEIDGFAVRLARVTLWMGHKLAVEELDIAESTLPLADLSGIQAGDALRMDWPRADAIIGNPPFHGDRNLRRVLGDDYVEWLRATYKVGVKDYCVYWFRKAHDHLPEGGRAGLVGTNSISQNRARSASLDYIVKSGGVITNAVSTQDWPGEAAVDVSIVNWVKGSPSGLAPPILDGVEVSAISPSLRSVERDLGMASGLPGNAGRAFYGPIPAGRGFVLAAAEAATLLDRRDAPYRDVIRPYLVGDDIANDPRQQPTRYIIDFGLRSLEDAMAYPAALDIAATRVKPRRVHGFQEAYRAWWRFARPLPAMRQALASLDRYVAGTAQGKRILFCWAEAWTCPSNLTTVFAFVDDYAMGVLTSHVHAAWAAAQGSTLENRIRYTPTTSFGTFPWPAPDDHQREHIAGLSRALIERRQEICVAQNTGLTKLYNLVDDGGYRDLDGLHRELDEAVARAYGWPVSVARDAAESNRRLLALNREITEGVRPYDPFERRSPAFVRPA